MAVLGTCTLSVAEPQEFLAAVDAALVQIFENDWVPHKRDHGTIGSLDTMYTLGIAPVANFTRSAFEGLEEIDSVVSGRLVTARLACANCAMACSKGTRLQGSQEQDAVEGPKYETAALFGGNCLVDDPQAIIHANLICNLAGMDTISAGALVVMLLDAADGDWVTWADLGLNPAMDCGARVIHLLQRIVDGEGIGQTLTGGALAVGQAVGIADLAPQVKGLEFPAYDPRESPGMALAYMTSDRGACHLRTYPFGQETSGVLPRFSLAEKPEFVKRQQDEKAAQECLGVCQFPYGAAPTGASRKLSSATTLGPSSIPTCAACATFVARCASSRHPLWPPTR
jgi:aldehyde:ferredoxin oxidoreductase